MTAGTYTLSVTTVTTDDYNNVTETAKITVNKLNAAITAKDASYVITEGGTYSVTLNDADGKAFSGQTVTFTLNGKNIGSAVTNAQGTATIKLTASMLKSAKTGTKNLIIKFAGDSVYNDLSKTVKITINKQKSKIKAKKKTYKAKAKTKKFKITLKDSKGKAIKNGKVRLIVKKVKKAGKKSKSKTSKHQKYIKKTNKKGKITFKIKRSKKGTYKATVKFYGNDYYKKATKTVKIKMK